MFDPTEFQDEWNAMSDEERSQARAIADVIVHVNLAQCALDDDLRHAWHTDPVGLVWFGDDPEWMGRRLYDARLDRHLEAKRP